MPHPIRIPLTAIVVVLLTAACLGGVARVSSETLLVGIDSLEVDEERIMINLAMRYLHDGPLNYDEMLLELSLDGEPLARTRQSQPFELPSRSRELIRVEVDAQPAGLERLKRLGSGERPSMRWSLQLNLLDDRGRESQVDYDGWLHAVPGQPNRFR